jgi:hypothetical protein
MRAQQQRADIAPSSIRAMSEGAFGRSGIGTLAISTLMRSRISGESH